MSTPRDKIVTDFARWTALSATRSKSPIKSRKDVYGLLDKVDFSLLFEVDREPINDVEFDDWHKSTVAEMCQAQPELNVGWAAKIINVYLKTRCYVGGYGRDNLINVIHPPIDNPLMEELKRKYEKRLLSTTRTTKKDVSYDVLEFLVNLSELAEFRNYLGIGEVKTYQQYEAIIQSCKEFSKLYDCSLFEVEQFWPGADSRNKYSKN